MAASSPRENPRGPIDKDRHIQGFQRDSKLGDQSAAFSERRPRTTRGLSAPLLTQKVADLRKQQLLAAGRGRLGIGRLLGTHTIDHLDDDEDHEGDDDEVDLLRGLVAPFLGAGCDLAIDGEVVARGPEGVESSPGPSTLQVQRLTEMAVQQHEYLCAELRRIRDEFEAEFAPERALLRVLRQRWMERVCDDRVRGEDALRYVFETAHAAATKADSSPSGQ